MSKQTKGRRFLIATTGIVNGTSVSQARFVQTRLRRNEVIGEFWRSIACAAQFIMIVVFCMQGITARPQPGLDAEAPRLHHPSKRS